MNIPKWLRAFLLPVRFYIVPPDDGGAGGDSGDGGAAGGDSGGAGGAATLPPLIGEDLSFSEGWQDRVGEEAKGLTFTNLKDMAKSQIEANSTIQRVTQENAEFKKQLEELGKNQGPEIPTDVQSYRAALKLPEGDLPEGVEMKGEVLDEVAKFAQENKISPDVTSKFIEFQIQGAAKEYEAWKNQQFEAIESAKAAIKQKVGAENYDTTISNAEAAAEVLGLEFTKDDLVQNPNMLLALSKIHKAVSPGALKNLGIGVEGQSTEGKLQQANDILVNEQNPHHKAYYDQSHPDHEAARDTYNRLILESGGGA